MVARKDDLDKIGEVLLEFFGTKRISQSLDLIYELKISGWEKWWQTELAMYLSDTQSIAEWDMEHRFSADKRIGLVQAQLALDIGFRLKGHAKGIWHFVELKQDNDYMLCIDKMCRDADKVFSAKKRSIDGLHIRYIACAGVFLTPDSEDEIFSYAEDALDSIDVDADGMFLEPVSRYHSLLVF